MSGKRGLRWLMFLQNTSNEHIRELVDSCDSCVENISEKGSKKDNMLSVGAGCDKTGVSVCD